jgi:hypothetical protein
MKDPYEVLGVRRSAGIAEIELAYRGRRSQYHPDRYADSDAQTVRWATDRMQEVNAAYASLGDEQQRARYDAGSGTDRSDDAQQASGTSKVSDRQDTSTLSLAQFLHQRFAPFDAFARTYFAPDIPPKKLSNALLSYGRQGRAVRAEDVVALMDSTIFGGAKDGVMLTEQQIRLKDLGDGLAVWEWPNIRSITSQKTAIYINGYKLIDCLAVNALEVARLVEGLQAFLKLDGKPRSPAPERSRPERQETGSSGAVPQKYRDMYGMARREFLDLCEKIQKLEHHLEEEFIDRVGAAEYFGYLEQCLSDARRAERAFSVLGEITALSKAVMTFADTGIPPAIRLTRGSSEDPKLVKELRELLETLQDIARELERHVKARQFFHP